jgi:hypothetical protein
MEPVGGKFTIFCPALRQGMGGGGKFFFNFQSLVFSFLYEFPLYKTVKRTWIKMLRIHNLQLLIQLLKNIKLEWSTHRVQR